MIDSTTDSKAGNIIMINSLLDQRFPQSELVVLTGGEVIKTSISSNPPCLAFHKLAFPAWHFILMGILLKILISSRTNRNMC